MTRLATLPLSLTNRVLRDRNSVVSHMLAAKEDQR